MAETVAASSAAVDARWRYSHVAEFVATSLSMCFCEDDEGQQQHEEAGRRRDAVEMAPRVEQERGAARVACCASESWR